MSGTASQAKLHRRYHPTNAFSTGERGAAGSQDRVSAPAFSLRVAVELGLAEGWLLMRNLVVLAGVIAGGALAWHYISEGAVSSRWAAGWQIGYGQMVLSATVLAAAQLAAGRARRDGMEDLYEGLPVPPATRAAGHLLSLLGVLPASVVLIGATSAFAEWRGAVGTPDPVAVVAGVLLVLAGGAIGVALGTRFPHPLVGLLGALIWLAPFSQSNRFSGPGTWLWPWVMPYQLGQFPSPLAGYPPTVAHAFYLAAIALLAAVVALAWRARTTLGRGVLLGPAALAVAVACTAGAVAYRPVATADIDRLVSSASAPASVQRCVTENGVRYCVYAGFGAVLRSVEGPVDAVVARVPARPAQPLTVEQTTDISLDDASLTHGQSEAQITAWAAQLNDAPSARLSFSAVYLPISAWPTNRPAVATARFSLAFAAAGWALGLPTSTGSTTTTQCVPLDQAREPIAIWLALVATGTSPGNSLGASMFPVQVADRPVMAWAYPGEYDGYLAAPGPQTTAAGYLLAKEMTTLPNQKVAQVLDRDWARWANWHTTQAQLAAALGIAVPSVPTPTLGAPAGQGTVFPPSLPLCT
jgi:hypothetical protein